MNIEKQIHNYKLEELERKYEDQIKLFPESNSFILLAEVLLKQKKIQKAISVLVKGLQTNKENITARFLLARIYYQSWNINQAKKELIKVIKLSPDNYASGKLLIEIYESEKEYEKALEIANDLLFYYQNDNYLIEQIDKLNRLSSINNIDQLNLDYKKHEVKGNLNKKYIKVKEKIYENETIVDICISQGLYKEAMKILNMLILKEPDNLVYKDKYEHVRKYLERKKPTN